MPYGSSRDARVASRSFFVSRNSNRLLPPPPTTANSMAASKLAQMLGMAAGTARRIPRSKDGVDSASGTRQAPRAWPYSTLLGLFNNHLLFTF